MAKDFEDLVQNVLAAPLGEVIASVGRGVAEAQFALDQGSIAATLSLYMNDDEETRDRALQALRDIGYRPTFYALPETTGEVRVSMNLGNAAQSSKSAPVPGNAAAPAARLSALTARRASLAKAYVTPVDANYANRYNYSAEASAKITFKIVPVPAPDGGDELRAIPDLSGLTVAAALERLEQVGLRGEVVDRNGDAVEPVNTTVALTGQDPAPGALGRLGDEVLLIINTA